MDASQKSLPCQCTGCLLLEAPALNPFIDCSCSLANRLWAAAGRVCNTEEGLVALDSREQDARRLVQGIITQSLVS